MNVDVFTFLKRSRLFFRELQANKYPNANTLAAQTLCSISTAKRLISRLQEEYRFPITYCPSNKGYQLSDPNFNFPQMLPAGRDELCALLLARDLLRSLELGELEDRINALWDNFCTQNKTIRSELEQMVEVFSSDSTIIADLADRNILRFVQAAASGDSVKITYRSPWRHSEDKCYTGRIGQVRFSDGHLYLGFVEQGGRSRVLNASFIKDFAVIPESVGLDGALDLEVLFKNWREGFGIWAHEELTTIEVRIKPPASRFYAAERWQAEQEDKWEGDVLVRRFPAIVSPEIARRVLSLGEHVGGVEPQELRDEVLKQAKKLVGELDE